MLLQPDVLLEIQHNERGYCIFKLVLYEKLFSSIYIIMELTEKEDTPGSMLLKKAFDSV